MKLKTRVPDLLPDITPGSVCVIPDDDCDSVWTTIKRMNIISQCVKFSTIFKDQDSSWNNFTRKAIEKQLRAKTCIKPMKYFDNNQLVISYDICHFGKRSFAAFHIICNDYERVKVVEVTNEHLPDFKFDFFQHLECRPTSVFILRDGTSARKYKSDNELINAVH